MTKKKFYLMTFVSLLLLFPAACSTAEPETPAEPDQKAEVVKKDPEPAAEPEEPVDEPEPEPVVKKDPPKKDVPAEKKVVKKAAPKKNPLLIPTTKYEKAPDEFKIALETTKGNITIKLVRAWSPKGVDHLHHLVKIGYYDNVAFFRAIEGFMVQFGIHGDPKINGLWSETNLQDEPVKVSNKKGYLTYAKSNAPNSRSTQLYINLVDNPNLDNYGFAPIGEVVEGMSIVESLYMGYGEGAPRGMGPSQMTFAQQGNAYLKAQFPKLDYIKKSTLVD
jgi:peptidyl-prolyl cis-trans isomerase A (cyclophilin A)